MKITIVSASTRIERETHKVVLGLSKKITLTDGLDPLILDLKEAKLPMFTEIMSKLPEPDARINDVYEKLNSADALLFVSPEYNGSYSAPLKNMVDFYPKSTFYRKAIGIVTVSSGPLGGMRAAMQLQQFILALGAITCPQMLLVPTVQNKFDSLGELTDESFTKSIDLFLKEFIWLANALKNAK
ncbi:MAG: NAD(P)H-dependent oxidoreductase [Opitutaceae bacterium]|nr:NAD(P)H-dependent oxidoreductase [Cytophagales bacterium]